MIDITNDINTALNNIDGITIYYCYPSSWSSLPAVSFFEINNMDYAQADGTEYLSQINYQVDIWSDDASENAQISMLVNEQFYDLGLRREMSTDSFETQTGLHHRSMKYFCLAKQDKTIYQK